MGRRSISDAPRSRHVQLDLFVVVAVSTGAGSKSCMKS
jgi:hypothetical protein